MNHPLYEKEKILELLSIKKVIAKKYWKKERSFISLMAYNLFLFNNDRDCLTMNNPSDFFAIMGLSIFGYIKYDGKIYDFTYFFKENQKFSSEFRSDFFLIAAALISLELIEFGSLKNAIINQYKNSPYLLMELKEILEENCLSTDVEIYGKYCRYLVKRMPEFLDTIQTRFQFYI